MKCKITAKKKGFLERLKDPKYAIIAIVLMYAFTSACFRYNGYHFEEMDNRIYVCDKDNEVCVEKHLDGHRAFLKLFGAYPNEE